jgi:undecaprenyl-diphosphatase
MDIIYKIDFAILDALQKIHCAPLDYLMAFFTYLGNGGFLWIAAAAVLLIFRKTRKQGFAVALALIFELIFNEKIIKHIFARTRPFVLNPTVDTVISQPSSYSFPSGHTCTAFAAATAIFFYDRRLGTVAYAAAALIGFSRNYFYVHFPTDVLCGALLGILLGFAAAKIIRAVSERISSRASSDSEPRN